MYQNMNKKYHFFTHAFVKFYLLSNEVNNLLKGLRDEVQSIRLKKA